MDVIELYSTESRRSDGAGSQLTQLPPGGEVERWVMAKLAEIFRDKLTTLIKETDGRVTQAILADAIGRQRSTVNKWLHKKKPSPPDFDSLQRVAEFFGVDAYRLIMPGGDGLKPGRSVSEFASETVVRRRLKALNSLAREYGFEVQPKSSRANRA